MVNKPSLTLPGTVEKIIRPVVPDQSEKAQIVIEGADHLYKELRIQNTLTDKDGKVVHLESGANVRITFTSDADDSATKT
jgi:hypothetical protein